MASPDQTPGQTSDQTSGQTPTLDWRDETIPVSRRFDDPYFSLAGGLDETRHVFLAGNGLPGRFCDGFRIAELGFGTGLNLLAVLLAHQGPGHVHYTSFEAFPLPARDIARALQLFPEVAGVADAFLDQWEAGATILQFPHLTATVILGDARETLPAWEGQADAWFLDGFSPAKNPELWSPELMVAVARHTGPGGTFATYTAAGHVRRALSEAGFRVTRQPGFGRKRHMSTGMIHASVTASRISPG
ncbi:tRNA (5-methylaminomethyl-2-thiouridine)(34)-methyltransferase MnmD [Tabrizicola sp.]|uniref:tRNA (5-methylaminomethyl-2-thiouridine)(34)-methyltransferase MnmD n=1 Tax=Tabrizicola sp. TaxID=2005166 RepID=UPI00273502FD|nr:tRNA (5-methylaminomethyl-2-thiouridine)(34)-methyltransferase MnmD [Tabrizicola sp.]MDP3195958.1 tRNA (5-methylaminomethyl-2-thiouridine)(34)-methyltransferase MnmD [Tabrizicola sp.]